MITVLKKYEWEWEEDTKTKINNKDGCKKMEGKSGYK